MHYRRNLTSETMMFASENKLLSWYYFTSTLLLTALAFTGAYAFTAWPVRILCSILAGLLTCRLFVLYHDFQHEAILRKSMPARILMNVIGWLTLSPNSIWMETHQHHHNHNSKFSRVVMGSFPTLSVQAYRESTPVQQVRYRIIRHPLMIAFAYIPIFLISFCLWPFFEDPKKYYDCGLSVMLHLLLYVFVFTLGGWIAVTFTLLIPFFLVFSLGGYIFYAQHNFPSVILKDDESWNYMEAALKSSSFIRMNRLMCWFTANIGYHHIHHVNSRIPFYRLPEAMEAIPELQHPGTTSLNPFEIARCLKLKLWDSEQERMITMNEFHASN